MISRFTIAQKIYAQGFLQLFVMLLMGGIAIYQMVNLGKDVIDIAEDDIPLMQQFTKLTEHQLEHAIYFQRVLVNAALSEQGNTNRSTKLSAASDKVSELQSMISKEIDKLNQFIQVALQRSHSEKAKAEYQKIIRFLEQTKGELQLLHTDTNQAISLAKSGQFDAIVQLEGSIYEREKKIDYQLIKLLDEVQGFTQARAIQAEEKELFALKLLIITSVVAVIIAIFLPFVVSRSIVLPIRNLIERLKQVADGDGDLTQRLDENRKDELAEVAKAFNHFLEVLNVTIKKVSLQADKLADISALSSETLLETGKNVDKQKQETELVATAVEEMGATTNEIARNTSDASQVSELAKNKVQDGKSIALNTRDIITRQASEVDMAAENLESLLNETNNIGTVTDTIQSIAEQTNLLALNAAIEAARAGESGRGFAVVADEVRSLAQRTRESTINIQDLVERLQEKAQQAVISMESTRESTQACLEKGKQTSQSFEETASAVVEISDFNNQIAAASEQQAMVTQEINKTLSSIMELAEQTSQGAKTTLHSNDNSMKELDSLRREIANFKLA